MDDIEDLVLNEDFWDSSNRSVQNNRVLKVRRRNKVKNTDLAKELHSLDDASEEKTSDSLNENSNSKCSKSKCDCDEDSDKQKIKSSDGVKNSSSDKYSHNKLSKNGIVSNLPGLAQIYVRTWGCAHNSSDSEYMAGQLAAYGYDITDSRQDADLWLLNSCTVKNPAEDHLRNEIRNAREKGKKVVVAGCVSQGAPKAEFLSGLSLVGVQQIDRIVEVVEETLAGNSVRMMGVKKEGGRKIGGAALNLPKIRRNPLVEIISINTGCLNHCTYCKTKHARGSLASYPVAEIVARAEQSFNEGVVEIWLTSEDTGAYGRDIGETLPSLLRELVKVIPEGCKLRLGMTNPPYILDHLEEMAELLLHPRVYRFLHLPVQSGSDAVLTHMRREYSREDFCRVVDTLREKVPGITIATDIICGYPTETEEDFDDTMSLCEKYKFPSLFINQFFPRPSTPAALLPRIDTKLVKNRTKRLSEFFQSYEPYTGSEDLEQHVLVTEPSHDGRFWVAHNCFYQQVLVPRDEGLLGKTLRVKITATGKYHLMAKILEIVGEPSKNQTLPQGAVSGITREMASQEKPKTFDPKYLRLLSIFGVLLALIIKLLYNKYS